MIEAAGCARSPFDPEAMGNAVSAAIESRRSVRAFSSQPVPHTVVERLLAIASRAPSGSNVQPWHVDVLAGRALCDVGDALEAAFLRGEPETPDYRYYPVRWREPYLGRRRAAGWGLYALAGVERGDREAGKRQRARNYRFFGAPVGLVFTVDRELERGSWLDYGMFLHSIAIAARGFGLDTCPQAAIANYPGILRSMLGIGEDRMPICGMALGHADPKDPVNALVTPREPVVSFTRWHRAGLNAADDQSRVE